MSDPSSDKSDIIRRCYLFADAEPGSIERLSERSTFETSAPKSEVFSAGDDVDGLRILVSGLVRIWINDAEGRELTLTLVEPGEAFGEIALLDGASRSANATVVDASNALLLKRSAFNEVLDDDPKLARHLIELLCDRLRRNTEDLRGFAFQDMRERLSRKLYELAIGHADIDGNSVRFTRKFSQMELGQMIGATREAVNKRLAALIFDGVISIDSGWIEIPDMRALQAIINQDE